MKFYDARPRIFYRRKSKLRFEYVSCSFLSIYDGVSNTIKRYGLREMWNVFSPYTTLIGIFLFSKVFSYSRNSRTVLNKRARALKYNARALYRTEINYDGENPISANVVSRFIERTNVRFAELRSYFSLNNNRA